MKCKAMAEDNGGIYLVKKLFVGKIKNKNNFLATVLKKTFTSNFL